MRVFPSQLLEQLTRLGPVPASELRSSEREQHVAGLVAAQLLEREVEPGVQLLAEYRLLLGLLQHRQQVAAGLLATPILLAHLDRRHEPPPRGPARLQA